MKLKTDMTPGVVGTALAAVAAGSLVLFSLVLQGSAFDTSFTDGLKALSPSESAEGISVQAAPESNDSAGDGTTVAETPPSPDGTAPSTETDSFSPVPGAGDIVASTDDPSDDDGDFPGASGGTDNAVDNGGSGERVRVDGPQATIHKDPNGRPGDVELPDRNGPRNTSPPHGSNPGSDNDRDRADGDRDEPRNDRQKARVKERAKNDRQKSWSKGRARPQNERQRWAKAKKAESNRSKDKSPDRPKPVEQSSPGKSNRGDSERDHRLSEDGGRDDPEPEDRNDRHDTRRDSDEDDDSDDGDDDDRDDDSDHSDDDSRGHSRTRGQKR